MPTPHPLVEQLVAGPALAAFLRVAAAWSLDEPQVRALLGGPSEAWWQACREQRSGSLSLDQVERIAHVLCIFRCLQQSGTQGAAEWLRRPRVEPIFAGRRPLDLMCLGDGRGLRQVAGFLKAGCVKDGVARGGQ